MKMAFYPRIKRQRTSLVINTYQNRKPKSLMHIGKMCLNSVAFMEILKKNAITIWEIGNRLTKIKMVCQYQVVLGMWINSNSNTLYVRGKIFTTLLEDRL